MRPRSTFAFLAAFAALPGGGCDWAVVAPPPGPAPLYLAALLPSDPSLKLHVDSLFTASDQLTVRVTASEGVVLDTVLAFSATQGSVVRLHSPIGTEVGVRVDVALARAGEQLLEGAATTSITENRTTRIDVTLHPRRPFVQRTGGDTVAIRDVTSIGFTAAGSNPAWTDFEWEFGDGTRASGRTVSHTYVRDGTFRVDVRAIGPAGAASASDRVVVGSLSGIWVRDAVQGVRARLEIVQQGRDLSGQYWVLFDPGSPFGTPADSSVSPLRGTVAGHNALTIEETGGCRRTVDRGSADKDLTVIGGAGYWGNPNCGSGGAAAWRYRRPTAPGPVY